MAGPVGKILDQAPLHLHARMMGQAGGHQARESIAVDRQRIAGGHPGRVGTGE